ncbi:MAG: putative selenium-dependent hydroxylase accessory protein YqeC [Deltaproteobacteria bacterium]|nr:putative selenium-dependent hydroxylase accessory protein YqeC [Deltaproteobacteria bacterium]
MSSARKTDTLTEAFDIQPGDVISLVGAGGKTTLMFALAGELTARKKLVITTTTTKIFYPSSSDTAYVLVSEEENEIADFILSKGDQYGHITIASEKIVSSGKLKGIDPELVSRLCRLSPVDCVIVEADGAARKPLKAPDIDFEPVIPQNSSLVIPVVGIDALGCALTEAHVFRSEIAAKISGTAIGEIVSMDTITRLITCPSGIIYGAPDHARIVPFINKMDLSEDLSNGRALASRILDVRHPRIDRVVLGQAKFQPQIREVVSR